MAEAADALDGDHGARRRVGVTQRVERGDPGAQQRRCLDRVHHLRHPHQTAGPGVHHLGVPTVLGGSRLRLVETVDEITTPTLRALTAVAAEVAKADPVADLPSGDPRPDRVDDADDLVAGDDGLTGIRAHAIHAEEIAVAHPAAEDPDPDMARLWFDDLALDQLELLLSRDLESAIRRHGGTSRFRQLDLAIANRQPRRRGHSFPAGRGIGHFADVSGFLPPHAG